MTSILNPGRFGPPPPEAPQPVTDDETHDLLREAITALSAVVAQAEVVEAEPESPREEADLLRALIGRVSELGDLILAQPQPPAPVVNVPPITIPDQIVSAIGTIAAMQFPERMEPSEELLEAIRSIKPSVAVTGGVGNRETERAISEIRDDGASLVALVEAQSNQVLTADQIPADPWAASDDFTAATWVDATQAGHSGILLAAFVDFDTVEIEWSDDGVTPNGSTTVLTSNPTQGYEVYLWISNVFASGTYWRVHAINGTTEQTLGTTGYIGIAWQGKHLYSPLIGIDDDISIILEAVLTRSIAAGTAPDGTFANVGVRQASRGQFAQLTRDVGLDNNRTVFGSLNTESPIVDVSVNFAAGVPNLVADTTVNTGTATIANAMSVITTGTDAAGSSRRKTRIPVRYRPGNEARYDFTAVFTTGVADSYQRIGAMADDDQDGVWIGYEGATFGITTRQDGTDSTVAQASWNGDPLDGSATSQFTSDGTPVVWDPTTGNVYRIRFGWLGFSVIVFEVQSPDGDYVPLHTIHYPNTSTSPHLYQNDLDIFMSAANTGNTSDLSLSSASWRGSSLGTPGPQARILFQKVDGQDGSLPTGGVPTIDPVLNADANVFDSGWIPTFDYPGGNFINIVGDQQLNVYVMNASNTAGDNIVGDTTPTIVTTAGVPATLAAPYFDDYYRILVSNESGSALTSYSIHNRGHEAIQQPLSLGLDQTVLSFFTAALTRSTVLAKNDIGTWSNITQSDLGGLRTSIKEQEAELQAKSCSTVNQSAVTATTTAQRLDPTPTADRKYVTVANHDNNTAAYYGRGSGVTSTTGTYLGPQSVIQEEWDDAVEIYVLTASSTASVSISQSAGTV